MTNIYKIAVIPGDNVGPEVIAEGVKVLKAAASLCNVGLEMTELPWGSNHYLATGDYMAPDGMKILQDFDAIYLGAMGDPARVPSQVTAAGHNQKIKKGMDLYVNMRPTRLLSGCPTPLKDPGEVDFVIVRENTEGEYAAAGGRVHMGTDNEVAVQVSVFTRKTTERVMRFGFELARLRNGKRLVTAVTKAGPMNYSMPFWNEVFDQVSADYPDIVPEKMNVDAMAMALMLRPSHYDVIVTTNQNGDILSDLASVIQGSVGMAPGGSINPEREHPSMFEPIHGSAPDIVGKGVANPMATIRAGQMMLDFLGEAQAARLIERAVEAVVAEGRVRTPDLGGRSGTKEVGDEVCRQLGQVKR